MNSALVHFSETPPKLNGHAKTFDAASVDAMLRGLTRTAPTKAVAEYLATLPRHSEVNFDDLVRKTNVSPATARSVLHRIANANAPTLDKYREGEAWKFFIPGAVHVRDIPTQPFQPPSEPEETEPEEEETPTLPKRIDKRTTAKSGTTSGAFRDYLKVENWPYGESRTRRQINNDLAGHTEGAITQAILLYGLRPKVLVNIAKPKTAATYVHVNPNAPKENPMPADTDATRIGDLVDLYLDDWEIGTNRPAERVRKDLVELTGATEDTVRENLRQRGTHPKKIINLSKPGKPGVYHRQDPDAPQPEVPTMPAEEPEPESDLIEVHIPAAFIVPKDGKWHRLPEGAEMDTQKVELRDGSVLEINWIKLPANNE